MKAGGDTMYRKMYIRLFNAATDAIAHIEEQNFGIARELLMEAQRECEEIYMEESQKDE